VIFRSPVSSPRLGATFPRLKFFFFFSKRAVVGAIPHRESCIGVRGDRCSRSLFVSPLRQFPNSLGRQRPFPFAQDFFFFRGGAGLPCLIERLRPIFSLPSFPLRIPILPSRLARKTLSTPASSVRRFTPLRSFFLIIPSPITTSVFH